jgi:hypothetical protein
MRFSHRSRLFASLLLVLVTPVIARGGGLSVGFGKADITPDPKAGPVWMAGYGQGRQAEGVHDPLWARAVVLDDGAKKIALVSVDLVGLQLQDTKEVRKLLPGYAYVLISSTHNHEGPDVVGLWGPTQTKSGVSDAYLKQVHAGVVAAVESASKSMVATDASYGTAEDESLIHDSRLPLVIDGTLRALKFTERGGGRVVGVLVQWNCHPENLGSKNVLLTADFPYDTVRALEAKYACPVAYFTGAVGGLMSAPEDKFPKPGGGTYRDGDFEFARVYGEAVAALAGKALEGGSSIVLTPFAVASSPVRVPLFNPGYRQLRAAGVLRRPAYASDAPDAAEVPASQIDGPIALETEVACLRLGELWVAAIPGEIYPELVVGTFQEPVEPAADMPEAPKETHVWAALPGPKTLLFGLANDEIGYIIPKRQWDWAPPFAYDRPNRQYGEVNSVGPEAAPRLMDTLARLARELDGGR